MTTENIKGGEVFRMDQKGFSSMMFAALPLVLFGVLLAGCSGSSSETMPLATGAAVSASTSTVGMDACARCHEQEVNDWMTSRHANAEGGMYSQGTPTPGQMTGTCSSCHDPLADSANVVAASAGAVPRPVVGCESCHGPGAAHVNAGGMHPLTLGSGTYDPGATAWNAGSIAVSGQFRMCTSCHELLDTAGTGTNPSPAHLTTPSPSGAQFSITDTHFALPGDYSGAGGANIRAISGYAMDFSSSTVCIDCHNPHGTADVNKEWASSAHGDKSGEPWRHYNWSCDAANCGGPFADRATCQRCHTATGFAGYADALQTRNAALASAIWNGTSPQLQYSAGFKPEMLLCRGCHTDNKGRLRNPGPYKASYKIPVGGFPSILPLNAAASYQYPDAGASNVCMPCHTGRGSGRAIHDLNTGQETAVDFSNVGFPDGHYLTAGGTMFRGTGYEYAGRNYADPSTFMHNKIGTPAQPGTGSMGPCIGCHMDRTGAPGNHLFMPITTNAGTIVVTSEVCFKCHAGSSIEFGKVVQDEKENYEFALQALENQLLISTPSFSFTTTYPYFTNTNWLLSGDTDNTGNPGGKNTMGAAFNFSLLHHEEAGFVHNSRYVKRLTYDSIDWLDDGLMNYSVGTTLTTLCNSSPQPWCAGATAYLLYGPAGSGSAERP